MPMKKFILSLLASVSLLTLQAQGTDDFATLTTHTYYAADTTTAGWVTANAAIYEGGAADNSSKGIFAAIGADNSVKAVCINGRTSKVGTITSPVLQNGCGTLSLNYACLSNESNGVSFNVAITANGSVVKTFDVVNTTAAKATVYSFNETVRVAGEFQIVITNNSPSKYDDGNKDRYSIWSIAWTEYDGSETMIVEAPVITPASGTFTEPQTVTITATEGNTIYYTLDGTTPDDAKGTLYKEPFTVSETTTVKAVAYDDNDKCSAVTTATLIFPKSIANTKETAYTTAEAIALLDDPSSTLTDTVYVKGVVSSSLTLNTKYKSMTYWLDNNAFEVYSGYGLNKDSITADNYLAIGDTVIVCGTIKKYNSTYEFNNSNYLVYIGKAPKPAVSIKNTPETAYSIAEAVAIVDAGEDLNTKVYVKGTISQIDEISTSYGNATYYISDDGSTTNQLEVYRGYSVGGAKFTNTEEVKVGDEVIVYGKLTLFKSTYEFTSGSQLYSVNGSTQAIHKIYADPTPAIDLSNAVIYNICGQRVSDMSKKGIYIVNGKKYVVK